MITSDQFSWRHLEWFRKFSCWLRQLILLLFESKMWRFKRFETCVCVDLVVSLLHNVRSSKSYLVNDHFRSHIRMSNRQVKNSFPITLSFESAFPVHMKLSTKNTYGFTSNFQLLSQTPQYLVRLHALLHPLRIRKCKFQIDFDSWIELNLARFVCWKR